MKAWLFVQEALVKLLETALAVPLGIPAPSMPSGTSNFYTGDGSTSSPYKITIGDSSSIPNFYLSCSKVTSGSIDRVSLGVGSQVALIKFVSISISMPMLMSDYLILIFQMTSIPLYQ